MRETVDAVLQRSPREQQLPTNNWSGPVLARSLREHPHLSLSSDQAWRLMVKLKFRQARPRPRLAKEDRTAS